MTRILSFIGIVGLAVALIGAALLGTRAFPRADVSTDISSEVLQPQAEGVDAAVSSPDSTTGPTTFQDTLADDSLILIGLALVAAFGIALLASIIKTAFVTRAGRIGCFLIAGIGTLVLVLGAGIGIFWLMGNLGPMAAAPPGDMAEEPAAEEAAEETVEPPTEAAAEEPVEEEPAEEAEFPTPTAVGMGDATPTAEPANTPTSPRRWSRQRRPNRRFCPPSPRSNNNLPRPRR